MAKTYCKHTDACMDGVYCAINKGQEGYNHCHLFPNDQAKCAYYEDEINKRNELLNCPFCGGKAKVKVCDGSGRYVANIGTEKVFGRDMTHCIVACEKCNARTQPYLTRRGVFNAWNRRADND